MTTLTTEPRYGRLTPSPLALDGWRGTALSAILDLCLAGMVVLSLLSIQLIVAFHTAFASMTMMAFIHAKRSFLYRTVPGTVLITFAVGRSVRTGQADLDELYEIPIMAMMLAMVFWAVQLVARLIAALSSQQRQLRDFHVASQIELKEQLFMSQRLATHGRLSAGIAHNFRNTLTAILSLAERIEYSSQDSMAVDASSRIQSQASEAAGLLSGMLHLSTEEPGHDRCDLSKALDEDRAILELLCGANVRVAFEIADGPLPVPVDAPHMTHVLLNLVMNANDALLASGTITVRAARRDDQIVVSVADDGIGMDKKTAARALEPFFTTKGEGRGSGLGLYMVQTIIEDAGGAVGISSEPGVGTTVEISLPAAEPGTEVRRGQSLDLRPEQFFGTETIVVAEDDPVIREQLVTALDMFGYQVREAPDGAVAYELVTTADTPVDLVVSDVVMPVCSGPELERRLDSAGHRLPFLYLSAYDQSSDPALDLPPGVELLAKPFGRTALLSRVREALEEKADGRA